jgi:DNA repair protein RecO (recombination protein O)
MPYHPIARTDAIPLRVTPFSNTSQIVTWLTPAHGKIATVIKGACRPKQESAGQYDLGYRCELLFYQYARNGLHNFRECAAIDDRRTCRGDWRRTAAISYLCRLAGDATPDGAHIPDLYHLTDRAITTLDQTPPPHDTLLLWFELRLLDLLGLSPRLRHCCICKTHLPPETGVRFSAALGGTLCGQCDPQRRDAAAIALSADVLALLQRWQRSRSYAPLRTVVIEPATRTALCQSLRHFLARHLETAPDCRTVAYQMVTMNIHP